jgi:AcrR family transcriptional regulator
MFDRMGRRSRSEALRTRQQIVETAVVVASTEGLDGITIGRLAGDVGLSKSGLLGHFPTKEELQVAALERAGEIFRAEVWVRVAGEEPGLSRLRALGRAWVDYLEREVFPGGCFFAAATMEYDDRPGPVRERLATGQHRLLRVIARDARIAQEKGDLAGDRTPEQLAYEMYSFILGANASHRLFRDRDAFDRAREAVDRLLTATVR